MSRPAKLHKAVRLALRRAEAIGAVVEVLPARHTWAGFWITWPDGRRRRYGGNRNDVTAKAILHDLRRFQSTPPSNPMTLDHRDA